MMLGARSRPGQAFAGKRRRAFELVLTRHELAAQELADGRFRYRLDEDVAPRPLEIGEPRGAAELIELLGLDHATPLDEGDRKSTRLNSSHLGISYAVFCLKK